VSAIIANNGEKRFKKTDEMSSAILHFPQERLATFTCSFGGADIGRYTLVGTKGTLTADTAYEYASGKNFSYRRLAGRETRDDFRSVISLRPK